MGNEKDVIRIGKKLEEIVSKKDGHGQTLDLLRALKSIPITLEILQKTRIGLAVNNIRKNCSDEDVITLAKTLIRSWKKLLEPAKDGKNDSGGDNNKTSSSTVEKKSSSSGSLNDKVNASKNQSKTSSSITQVDKPRQSFPSNTNNEVRLKCRELLADALKTNLEKEIDADPEEIAAQIEDCIYKEFKDVSMKYKNRIRSRVSNLKDLKNPDLKYNVLKGHIEPSRIAVMTAEEMASDEMKELRQKLTKEAINDAQMAVTGGTKTDLIKCPKCKQSNTTYNQVQTRSADEPMTTFCFCNECGKRWKFC